MKSIITISSLAKQHLAKLLKNNNTNKAFFAVESGGCNGLKYSLKPITKNIKNTELVYFSKDSDKYELHVCQKSLLYLMGTNIDWNDDFMGQSFTFDNPNKSGSCGCGSTFSI